MKIQLPFLKKSNDKNLLPKTRDILARLKKNEKETEVKKDDDLIPEKGVSFFEKMKRSNSNDNKSNKDLVIFILSFLYIFIVEGFIFGNGISSNYSLMVNITAIVNIICTLPIICLMIPNFFEGRKFKIKDPSVQFMTVFGVFCLIFVVSILILLGVFTPTPAST